jgi:HPt (histidine-containing phosphotransfer) domain-containing protein
MQRKPVHLDTPPISPPRLETPSVVEFRQEAIDRLVSATGARGAVLVLGTMIDSAPRLLEALESALRSGDAGSFSRSAHSLKANAGTVGAGALVQAFQELEDFGRAGDLHAAGEKMAAAQQAYRNLIEKIRNLRENYSAQV